MLPNCLVQMALNWVFIPLSMLMTCALNNIKTNHNVKYKHLMYDTGAGKTFLDQVALPAEDELSNFEFGQVYTNWFTLIKTFSDPIVELVWNANHKCMASD